MQEIYMYGLIHKSLVVVAIMQNKLIILADVSSGARGIFGLSFPLHSYFVYASSKDWPIGTFSANSLESDLGCTLGFNFDKVTLTSQKFSNHANTVSVIAVKQTVTTFHNKHCYK